MPDDVGQTIVSYNKYEVYNMIDDYKWMIELIKQYGGDLEDVDFKGVAQYGLEAALPSGKGIVSMALENEVVRRNERFERLSEYINKVNFININRKKITDEKEKEILDCLLDGDSIASITRQLSISRKRINRMRNNIVDLLVDE